MTEQNTIPHEVGRLRQPLLIAGGVFLLIFVVGAFLDRRQFFQAYLFAYLFWTGIPLGSLALLMLQHLTGGHWGLVIRRVLEASSRTIPLMALLFVPIVVGAGYLYPWTSHEVLSENPVLMEKAKYLNLTFFSIRAVIYFAFWYAVAYFLNAWSLKQDSTADRQLAKKMRVLSGPGLVFFVVTVTFAAIDWGMSLTPEWTSTIYGLIYVAAWALSGLAFTIAVMAVISDHKALAGLVKPSHFQDLGKLLLALVMLWAYFAFSQFLLIWSGNLPEEISWYLPRTKGPWGVIALLVVVFHFGFPFLMLLSRQTKRNRHKLVLVAGLVLLMRLVDICWMIEPSFHEPGTSEVGFHVNWLDFVAPVAIGGIWLATFLWQLEKRPLIPINDPQFDRLVAQVDTGH